MRCNNYLHIKPFATYPKDSNRKTTLTKFETVLLEKGTMSEKAANTAAQENVDETKNKDAEQSAVAASDNKDVSVLFVDPKTGKTVIYKDVAKESETTSVSAATNTTSAASMKETKYDAYFKAAAKKYNVSESLLKAIAKAESNFNARDVSSAGAMGVMQLMPSTATGLGVTDPFDPEQNIMGGAKCIAQKLKEFNGDVSLALAAYNAGSGAVRRNGGVPSYCKDYVKKVLSYKEAFETAKAVG